MERIGSVARAETGFAKRNIKRKMTGDISHDDRKTRAKPRQKTQEKLILKNRNFSNKEQAAWQKCHAKLTITKQWNDKN